MFVCLVSQLVVASVCLAVDSGRGGAGRDGTGLLLPCTGNPRDRIGTARGFPATMSAESTARGETPHCPPAPLSRQLQNMSGVLFVAAQVNRFQRLLRLSSHRIHFPSHTILSASRYIPKYQFIATMDPVTATPTQTTTSSTETKIFVAAHVARKFIESVLVANDVTVENATVVADCLIAADLRGVDTHGINRIPSYLERIRQGVLDGSATPVLSQITPVVTQVDARNGWGFVAADAAMAAAIESAKVSVSFPPGRPSILTNFVLEDLWNWHGKRKAFQSFRHECVDRAKGLGRRHDEPGLHQF
jgi:hypothetical protein